MLCRICGIAIKSNEELKLHVVFSHRIALEHYYKHNPQATKFCNKCGRELPITEFYVDRHKTSGYRTQCIRCIHPEGFVSTCPLCHRVLHESAIVTHLKEDHDVPPKRAYGLFVRRKRCPKCNTVKPLKDFYKSSDGEYYYSYCRRCSLDRQKASRLRRHSLDHSRDASGKVGDIRRAHTADVARA